LKSEEEKKENFFFLQVVSIYRSPDKVSEVLIRTQTDKWIVARKSDQREFYVIFDPKNTNMVEISEEVKKLVATNFSNIFID
jgi:hypothetical protein